MDGLVYGLTAIVLFVLVLGGLVLIHELGHFIAARLMGVRVLEFGVGFPPRARVLSARGETLWTLNWLPIGGFVRLEDEVDGATDDPRSFANKPLRHRLGILVAGAAMNIVLAAALFFFIALLATPYVGARIGVVQPESPAAIAGLQAGDRLYAVDGERFDFFGDRSIVTALRAHAGETVALDVRRADGTTGTVSATLRPPAEAAERGALGVSDLQAVFDGGYLGHDVVTSARIAGDQVVRWGGLILGGLASLVGGLISNPTAPPEASGPIGIAASLADVFLGSGPIMTLFVAGVLSVNLGVVNILPFPPLDGGRMAILILKRLTGPRLSARAERLTYAVGFVVLMAFILWISGFDIARLGTSQ